MNVTKKSVEEEWVWQSESLDLVCLYICIYIYYERKKGCNYISRQACFVNRFTLQGFKMGNVVTSFFPLIIFILLCFNVLSTVPCENRLAYIYMQLKNFKKIQLSLKNTYQINFLPRCPKKKKDSQIELWNHVTKYIKERFYQ